MEDFGMDWNEVGRRIRTKRKEKKLRKIWQKWSA